MNKLGFRTLCARETKTSKSSTTVQTLCRSKFKKKR